MLQLPDQRPHRPRLSAGLNPVIITATIFISLCLRPALSLGATEASAAAPPAASEDPIATIKNGINQAISVFQDHQMPLAQRRETLRVLAGQYFDFPMMARSVLGYHWRTLSPAQRAQFVPIFTGFIENAYLSRLQDYTVTQVQHALQTARIDYRRQAFEGSDYAQVFTSVTLRDQAQPIDINYYLIRTPEGWKVYDLSIEAISIIGNFRNQFNRVINDAGFDTLLADLRTKTQRLQQYMQQQYQHPHPPPHS